MRFQAAILALPAIIYSEMSFAIPATSTTSANKICAVCPPSIVFGGRSQFLALAREEGGNTLQCNYDIPRIQGFSPACLYANIGGSLIFTNTGGSCPQIAPTETQNNPLFSVCTAEPIPLPPPGTPF